MSDEASSGPPTSSKRTGPMSSTQLLADLEDPMAQPWRKAPGAQSETF